MYLAPVKVYGYIKEHESKMLFTWPRIIIPLPSLAGSRIVLNGSSKTSKPWKGDIHIISKKFKCLQTLFLGSFDAPLFPKVLVLRAPGPPGKLYGSLAWARGGSVGRSPLQQHWPNCEQSGKLRLEKNGFENSSRQDNHSSYVLFGQFQMKDLTEC